MGWIEYLLIVAGSSLEIFVAMECQGSLIQKVNKKQLTAICFIVAVCQLLAMYIGYFLSSFLNGKYSVKDEALLGEIISIGILIGLGIRLIGKAIRNERIEEHCQAQLDMKRVLRIAGITAFYTVLAGIAFGFLGTGLFTIMIMVALLYCYLYSGRHLHRYITSVLSRRQRYISWVQYSFGRLELM